MFNIIKIGEKIKELRKANDMTQEKLADYLGVSFQAISKWECGIASPDISLLVPISRLFSISIDELFDNSKDNIDLRLTELKKVYDETWKTGDTKKRYEISLVAVEEYPGNLELLENLASSEWYYGIHEMSNNPAERIKLFESSVKHAETVIENTNNDILKDKALITITYSLHDLGRIEEAKKYAEMTDDDNLIIMCLSGNESIKRKQEKINSIVLELLHQISAPGNRIEELEVADAIIKAIMSDSNYLLYNDELMHIEVWTAMEYTKKGSYEKAIESLYKAHKYAEDFDKICLKGNVVNYTSPILDHIKFNPKILERSGTSTLCEDFIEYLGWKCFDSMRDMSEFKKLYNL